MSAKYHDEVLLPPLPLFGQVRKSQCSGMPRMKQQVEKFERSDDDFISKSEEWK